MKKQTIIAILAVVFAAMAMPQNTVAKEKKVKYLGHQYYGEVNKEKVPFGKGVINIGGLLIEGNFNSNSVTNAQVYKSDYVKIKNREYFGEVAFDESNNINLKSNGKIVTTTIESEYSSWTKTFNYQLQSDLIVNDEDFEPDTIRVTLTRNPFENWHHETLSQIGPPTEIPDEIVIKLQDVKRTVEREVRDYLGRVERVEKVDVKTKAYVFSTKEYEKKNLILTDYKDSQGRIWNLDRSNNTWSVQYPDGSYYKEEVKGVDGVTTWKTVYPDGKFYEYEGNLSIGNGLYLGFVNNDDFCTFKKSPVIPRSKMERLLIDGIEGLSDKEVEKVIKEKLSSALIEGGIEGLEGEEIFVWTKEMNRMGTYQHGKFVSEATKEAKKVAGYKAEIATFKKKWGFDPNLRGRDVIKVGRKTAAIDAWNEERRKEYEKEYLIPYMPYRFSLSIDHGASKCYDLIFNGKKTGHMWVKNGVVTSVSWY